MLSCSANSFLQKVYAMPILMKGSYLCFGGSELGSASLQRVRHCRRSGSAPIAVSLDVVFNLL